MIGSWTRSDGKFALLWWTLAWMSIGRQIRVDATPTEDKIDGFRLRLHDLLQETSHTLVSVPVLSSSRALTLDGVPRPSVWSPLAASDVVFAGTEPGSVAVLRLGSEIALLGSAATGSPITAMRAFGVGSRVWSVCLHPDSVRVYEFASSRFHVQQSIPVPGPSLVSVVSAPGRPTYLALASTLGRECKLRLFEWQGSQFDQVANRTMEGRCGPLCVWAEDWTVSVAVGDADASLLRVFKYRTEVENGRLSLILILKSTASVIHHFHLGGIHYLICGEEKRARIFRRSGSDFEEWQQIEMEGEDSQPLLDISVLPLEHNVVISLVSRTHLHYYARDASGHFVKLGTLRPSEGALRGATLWSGTGHRPPSLLPLFERPRSALVVFRLDVAYHNLPSPRLSDVLSTCLDNVNLALGLRRGRLEAVVPRLEKVWTTRGHAVLTAPVHVTGGIRSPGTVRVTTLAVSTEGLPSGLRPRAEALRGELDVWTRELHRVLRRSLPQTIAAAVHFVGRIKASEGSIGGLENDAVLNGLLLSREAALLKKYGAQAFASDVRVDRVETRTLILSGTLNGKHPDDLLLLRGEDQVSNGGLSFGKVSAGALLLPDDRAALNGIRPDHLVLDGRPQRIRGTKKFGRLVADTVDAGRIEAVNLRDIVEAASKRSDSEASITFASPLRVLGNVTVDAIRGVDLDVLAEEAVRRGGQQEIAGVKRFRGGVHVAVGANVPGLLNGAPLSALLWTQGPQQLSGRLTFASDLSFEGDVESGLVNGLDLGEEAVPRRGPGPVHLSGRTHFGAVVVQRHLELAEGVRLDGFDPSLEAPRMIRRRGDAVRFEGAAVLGDVSVAGHLEVGPGFPMFELMRHVWRRSTRQSIASDVRFGQMHVDALSVHRVNGLDPDADLVSRFGNSTIASPKHFEGPVVVRGSLALGTGSSINGRGVDAIHRDLVWVGGAESPVLETAVHFASTLTVDDILGLNHVNGAPLSHFMRARDEQQCTGLLSFGSASMDHLASQELLPKHFDGRNFKEFLDSVVSVGSSRPITNKTFAHIEGNELWVRGRIGGVDLPAMKHRVITLSTFQEVHSNLEFVSPVSSKEMGIRGLLNDVDVSSIVENAVHLDRPTQLPATIEFKKNVLVNDVTVARLLDDVDLGNLQSSAFDKTRGNVVHQFVSFRSRLLIKTRLDLEEGASLDGVQLDRLLPTSSDLSVPGMSFANVVALQDVFAAGTINQCDVPAAVEAAAPAGRSEYEIYGEHSIGRLEVRGDLHIDGIPGASDLHRHGEFLGTSSAFQSLRVQRLNVQQSDLRFVLGDAVRGGIQQEVVGKKRFLRGLDAIRTEVSRLEGQVLGGVAASRLLSHSVTKSGTVTIQGQKTLSEVTAEAAVIQGSLNGVRVPADVVLTDTSDSVGSTTAFHAPVTALEVDIRGQADGVPLSHFLANRLTLSHEQLANSSLVLAQDTVLEGNTKVGVCNGIRLGKIIKRNRTQTMRGSKRFVEDWVLSSDLNLLRDVNGRSAEWFADNVLGTQRDEVLTWPVSFSGLAASSLISGDVSRLWDAMHDTEAKVEGAFDFLNEVFNLNVEALYLQREAVDDLLSDYAYFELHQRLDLNRTTRILPVFEIGSFGDRFERPASRLVAWLEGNGTCAPPQSLELEVPEGEEGWRVRGPTTRGRLFPLPMQEMRENAVGFRLRTDRPHRCSAPPKRSTVRTIRLDFAQNRETKGRSNTIAHPSGAALLDARLLETQEGVYLVIAYRSPPRNDTEGASERVYLYAYDPLKDRWLFHQKIHRGNPSAIDLVTVLEQDSSRTFLAVSGEPDNPGLAVYEWQDEKFEPRDAVSTSVSSSVLWVPAGDVFLLLAREKSRVHKDGGWVEVYGEPLEVYRFGDRLLRLNHTVDVPGVHTLDTFRVAGETFVVACSRHMQTVFVLQFRGFQGLRVVQAIPAPGVEGAAAFASARGHLMLGVASRTGHSAVMRAVVRGRTPEDEL